MTMYHAGMMNTRLTLYLFALILTACNLTPASAATPWPTATTVQVAQASCVPTLDRQLQPVATPQPSATFIPMCPPVSGHTGYTVVADINLTRHTASVLQTVRYVNNAGGALSQLLLDVDPNHWLNAFHLESVMQDDDPLAYNLTGQRLTIDLPQTLSAGCAISFDLAFQIAVPPIDGSRNAYDGYFGYSERQLNLGYWLPVVAAYGQDGWIAHDSIVIGENTALEIADWDVTLSVMGASESLLVAAPGDMTRVSDSTWRFQLRNARDFSVSMSEAFLLSSQETASGVTVELYHFPDENGASAMALETAARSLSMYEDLFGAYPNARMVVVQGDFPDGMEFSGLVFVSGDWFARYDGSPAGYLMLITAHEVSHQWWYARVGNDGALNPWLDEAFATYCEYIFIEEYYPDLKDWWWQWRVNRLQPQGYVDSTIYDFNTIREYINAVYLRGVLMLHDIRADIGTEAFFDLLRRYAAAGDGQLVTPDLFWSLLTADQLQQTRDTRRRYFRYPQVELP